MSTSNEKSNSPNPEVEADKIDSTLALTTALETIKIATPEVKQRFAEKLLGDPVIKGMVYRSRPKGPYYNKGRALEIKGILDKMMEDKRPKAFYTERFNCSIQTLKLRIHQSFQYLIEDAELLNLWGTKYKDFWSLVQICIEKENKAVVIRFLSDPNISIPALDDAVVDAPSDSTTREWKIEMDKWLEDEKTVEPFERKIDITQEEANTLDESLSNIGGIMATVETKRIKIIKFKG